MQIRHMRFVATASTRNRSQHRHSDCSCVRLRWSEVW